MKDLIVRWLILTVAILAAAYFIEIGRAHV